MDTLTLFSKNLNQMSLTPRWPLTPCLLRSHVWLYPRIIVSKSHDSTSVYVDTVINFAKYHIHTTYYVHSCVHTTYRMSDHIVSYWTQFRRDKNQFSKMPIWRQSVLLAPIFGPWGSTLIPQLKLSTSGIWGGCYWQASWVHISNPGKVGWHSNASFTCHHAHPSTFDLHPWLCLSQMINSGFFRRGDWGSKTPSYNKT